MSSRESLQSGNDLHADHAKAAVSVVDQFLAHEIEPMVEAVRLALYHRVMIKEAAAPSVSDVIEVVRREALAPFLFEARSLIHSKVDEVDLIASTLLKMVNHRISNQMARFTILYLDILEGKHNLEVLLGPVEQELMSPFRVGDLETCRPSLGGFISSLGFVVPDNIELDFVFPSNRVLMDFNGGMLSEVLLELVSNAVYAMSDGGKITVSLRELGDRILLGVKDTGKGIAPGNLVKVFDKSFTKRDGGTGQGLFYVKTCMENFLNGKVSVESELGKGTEFTLSFPKEAT